jgi:hypothetical protein
LFLLDLFKVTVLFQGLDPRVVVKVRRVCRDTCLGEDVADSADAVSDPVL